MMQTHADFKAFAASKGGCVRTINKDSYRYLNLERIAFRCSRGHEWTRAAAAFRYDKRPWCRTCNLLGDNYWSKTQYEEYANAKNGALLACPEGDIYQNSKLTFRCKQGHEWTCIAYSIKTLHSWCRLCQHDSYRGNISDAEVIAEERGGRLLSTRYRRNSDHLEWECRYGHVFKARFASVKKGTWCRECSSSLSERIVRIYFEHLFGKEFPKTRPPWLRTPNGKRLELDGFCEDLMLAFEHQGSQHYAPFGAITASQVLAIRKRDEIKKRVCRKHGVRLVVIPQLHAMTPLDRLASTIAQKCKRYGIRVAPAKLRQEIAFNRAYFGEREGSIIDELHVIAASKGGKLLDSNYAGRISPLTFSCARGHVFAKSPNDVLTGRWCYACSKCARLSIEVMQEWARERNGECLSRRYRAARYALKWRCNVCGNRFAMSANRVQQGQWCPRCAVIRVAGHHRKTIEQIHLEIKGRPLKLVSKEYENAHQKLKWQCCRCKHRWSANYNKIQQGRGCPMCGRKRVWITRRRNQRSEPT